MSVPVARAHVRRPPLTTRDEDVRDDVDAT